MIPKDLLYIPDFLAESDQLALLAEIDALEWSTELKRRVQHYGYKYDYTAKSVSVSMLVGPLPEKCQALAVRLHVEGIFAKIPDQLIVNEYMPGQGMRGGCRVS